MTWYMCRVVCILHSALNLSAITSHCQYHLPAALPFLTTLIFILVVCRGVEIVSLFSIFLPCSHILCLLDIHQMYRTMSCMTGYFHTPAYLVCYLSTCMLVVHCDIRREVIIMQW